MTDEQTDRQNWYINIARPYISAIKNLHASKHFAKMFDADKTRMVALPCGEETMTIVSSYFLYLTVTQISF